MLNNKIVFYADDVYLDVVPPGFALPTSSQVRIPIDVKREKFFAFGVGQLDNNDNDIDFEPLVDVHLDEFPRTPDGQVMLVVSIEVSKKKQLSIRVNFALPGHDDEAIGDVLEYSNIKVD